MKKYLVIGSVIVLAGLGATYAYASCASGCMSGCASVYAGTGDGAGFNNCVSQCIQNNCQRIK